jgi:hypothetical protein
VFRRYGVYSLYDSTVTKMNTTKGYKGDYQRVMSELKANISFALVRINAWLSEDSRLQTRYDLKIEGDLTAYSVLSWVEGDFNPPWDRRVVIIPFLGGRHLSVGDLISTDITSGFNGPMDGWGCDIYDDERIRRYHDMKRYESFDAFLTEHVKNSICEDVLGEILTFL